MGGAATHARIRLGHLDNNAHADALADTDCHTAMILRIAAVVLIMTVLVSACVPAPTPEPLALVQRIGFGEPRQSSVPRTLRNRGMWHYDWSPICANGNVPLVYIGITNWETEQVDRCDAMSEPILMLGNEPEWRHQSNWSPEYTADVIAYYDARWHGELWCCGTLSSHIGFLDRTYHSYTTRYGEWPVDRLHIHVYANDGFTVSSPIDEAKWVERSRREITALVAWLRSHGLPERIVVSECCILSNDAPAQEYIATMDAYMRMLRSFPQVESVAWFSYYYHMWRGANLVDQQGVLTEVGEAWLAWRWR